MAGLDYAAESATQSIYINEWAPFRSAGNLGVPMGLLTVPRRMQFSLRYDF